MNVSFFVRQACIYYNFFLLTLIFFLAAPFALSQSIVKEPPKNLIYIQPGLLTGKNVPNYTSFPESDWRKSVFVDIGIQTLDSGKNYSNYYNYPQFGISLTFNRLGNDTSLGNEFSLMPFFTFNPFRNHQKGLYFKLGIGVSYFTKFYNNTESPENEAVGSALTWGFQGILSKSIITISNGTFMLNIGYYHASNGHIQLPNFGLNSGVFGLSYRFYNRNALQQIRKNKRVLVSRDKMMFIILRQGTGINELGGTRGPIGGDKGLIYSGSIGGGIIFRQNLKVRAGFTYRYYKLVSQYRSETRPWNYSQSANWFASNIYFFAGCEFLVGHFGMDAEGGLNLYKPFYSYFFDTFEHGSDLAYFLKKTFCTRMGLNLYLISNERKPKNNLSVGAHINANFGEADFSELSITYTRILK